MKNPELIDLQSLRDRFARLQGLDQANPNMSGKKSKKNSPSGSKGAAAKPIPRADLPRVVDVPAAHPNASLNPAAAKDKGSAAVNPGSLADAPRVVNEPGSPTSVSLNSGAATPVVPNAGAATSVSMNSGHVSVQDNIRIDQDYVMNTHDSVKNVNDSVKNVNDLRNTTSQKHEGNNDLKPVSFAQVVRKDQESNKVNFRLIHSECKIDGVDLVLPKESILQISDRFANTLYGYFVGKRLAFPIVENYVKNTWAKFGIRKVMMNAAGFFFFKFDTQLDMKRVLESGPWLIRSVPIILNIWTPESSLVKNDVSKVPVWIKIHDVPLVAFTEEGLSLIATKVGTPILLDSATTTMCLNSWGRSSYARALVEVDAAKDLKENLIIGIPKMVGEDFTSVTLRIEYEWKPPRCSTCMVFGHNVEHCPKHVKPVVTEETHKDDPKGFILVDKKKGKGIAQQQSRQVEGVRLSKPKPNFVYRPKTQPHKENQNACSTSGGIRDEVVKGLNNNQPTSSVRREGKGVQIANSFGGLNNLIDSDGEEDVETVFSEGASTPGKSGFDD